jgi:glycosyltransferase involved in cell wall biosynthesis
MKDISIVVPLLNEKESLPELEAWIVRVMNENKFSYEIIFIDDGSTDGSWETIKTLSQNNPNVKGIKFRRNYGKSAALNSGFSEANSKVIITMDADLQGKRNDMTQLPKQCLPNYSIGRLEK